MQLPRIIEYVVVAAHTPSALVGMVNDTMKEGYQPLGGISVSDETQQFVQALVRYDDEQETR